MVDLGMTAMAKFGKILKFFQNQPRSPACVPIMEDSLPSLLGESPEKVICPSDCTLPDVPIVFRCFAWVPGFVEIFLSHSPCFVDSPDEFHEVEQQLILRG